MSISLNANQGIKTGGCPHGLPAGACPICSGGGGGGGKVQTADFSAKPGEMSWSECAAIGAFLKAQKLSSQDQKQATLQPFIAGFESKMNNLIQKLSNFVVNIQATPSSAITKTAVFVVNAIIIPLLNVVKNLPLLLNKTLNQLVQKIVDISDKLAAMLGEMKNKLKENISKALKRLKKKGFSLMGLFGEIEEIDEDKKITKAEEGKEKEYYE